MKKSILMTALIAVFLGSAAFAQGFDKTQMKKKMMKKHHNMMEMLDLTEQQQDKMEALRLEHKKQMVDLKADIAKAKIAVEEVLASDNPVRDSYLSAVENLLAKKDAAALAMANHKFDVLEILNDEQKEIFLEHKGMMGHGMVGHGDGPRMMKHKMK